MTDSKEIVEPKIMELFPSGTAAATFPDWVANHAGLEQVLSVAGLLSPPFHEVKGLVLWDAHVAERLRTTKLGTPYGDDLDTIERYFNTINLVEFFLMASDDAVERSELVEAFARVLRHFWGVALRLRFPDRRFRFEVAEDLYGEEGPCLTFWQER